MNEDYIQAQREDLESKRNTSDHFYDYEYVDYSNLQLEKTEKSLRHILVDLREKGLTEKEIIKKLQ